MAVQVEKLITEHLDLWTQAQTAKSTSGRGSNNKIELTGIKKLRELILELAVRGKLVPQDPNDEPACELLKRIAAEKEALVKAGKLKKQKPLPPITEEEKPFELPTGWEWCNLDQLSPMSLVDGDWIESKDQDEFGQIRLIQLADVGVNQFKNVSSKYVNDNTFESLKCFELNVGDILIARLPAPIGRACIFPNIGQRAITVVDVAVLRTLGLIDAQWIVHLLNSSFIRVQVEEFGKGATRFRIATGNLKTILVPVPTENEQRKIVSKVDSLMSLCDQLEQQSYQQLDAHNQLVDALLATLAQSQNADELASNWQLLAAHFDTLFTTEYSIDALKQTILQLAVMGKLVKQDPNDEPASELLKRIAAEKDALVKAGKIKKQKPLPPISDEEKPFELPEGWEWCRLGEPISFLNGYAFKSEWFTNDGIRLLRNVNISHGSVRWIEKACLAYELAENYNNFRLDLGDVVISLDRPIINTGLKYAVLSEDDLPCLLLQRVAKFQRLDQFVLSSFLTTWLNSSCFISQIDPGRSNGVPHISTKQLELTLFPIFSKNEQRRIKAKVDELMALCDALACRLKSLKQTQAVLAEALVEQVVA
jgi:type I restriction enzyme, S subunit